MSFEILGGRLRDRASHGPLLRWRRHEHRLLRVRAESNLHEDRRHQRGDKHSERGLLYTAIRPRMHALHVPLDDVSEIRRLAEMLVLHHVLQDESERIAWGGLVIPPMRPLFDYAWFVGFAAAGAVYYLLMRRRG